MTSDVRIRESVREEETKGKHGRLSLRGEVVQMNIKKLVRRNIEKLEGEKINIPGLNVFA